MKRKYAACAGFFIDGLFVVQSHVLHVQNVINEPLKNFAPTELARQRRLGHKRRRESYRLNFSDIGDACARACLKSILRPWSRRATAGEGLLPRRVELCL